MTLACTTCGRTALPLCRPKPGAEIQCVPCLSLAGHPMFGTSVLPIPESGWRVVGEADRLLFADVKRRVAEGLSPAMVRAPSDL